MTNEEITREVETFCMRMSEHVDAVQVVLSVHRGGLTEMHSCGEGNFYTRKAMCEEYVNRENNQNQAFYIASEIRGDEED